jgi:hypothetical protein
MTKGLDLASQLLENGDRAISVIKRYTTWSKVISENYHSKYRNFTVLALSVHQHFGGI